MRWITVLEADPEQQGLKHRTPMTNEISDSVLEADPEQQGLKPSRHLRTATNRTVLEADPEQQGLKLRYSGPQALRPQ